MGLWAPQRLAEVEGQVVIVRTDTQLISTFTDGQANDGTETPGVPGISDQGGAEPRRAGTRLEEKEGSLGDSGMGWPKAKFDDGVGELRERVGSEEKPPSHPQRNGTVGVEPVHGWSCTVRPLMQHAVPPI